MNHLFLQQIECYNYIILLYGKKLEFLQEVSLLVINTFYEIGNSLIFFLFLSNIYFSFE